MSLGSRIGPDKSRLRLCHIDTLHSKSAKAFVFDNISPAIEIFVVRQANSFFAYINSCPHTGVTLNWQKDEFFDLQNQYIQCSMHGALFRKTDGYCIYGPCAGQSLKTVPIEVSNDELFALLKT
jgi:nitrite reductase/ring-hydroxylating ferredoxin subunit